MTTTNLFQTKLAQLEQKLEQIQKAVPNFEYEVVHYNNRMDIYEYSLTGTGDDNRIIVHDMNDVNKLLTKADFILEHTQKTLNIFNTIDDQVNEDDEFDFYLLDQIFVILNENETINGELTKDKAILHFVTEITEEAKKEEKDTEQELKFKGINIFKRRFIDYNGDLVRIYNIRMENLDIHELQTKRQAIAQFVKNDA
jgi:hypothetical protein